MVRPGGILLLGIQSRRWPMPNRCFLIPLHLRFLRPMISPPYRYTGPVIKPLIINTWDITVAIPNSNVTASKPAIKGSFSISFLTTRKKFLFTLPLLTLSSSDGRVPEPVPLRSSRISARLCDHNRYSGVLFRCSWT